MQKNWLLNCLSACALVCAAVSSSTAVAQHVPGGTNLHGTLVTISATDPSASEAGDPGRFAIKRGEQTNGALMVWLQISGSAMPGGDYQALSNIVIIPDGARGVELSVLPIDDLTPEGSESVTVRIVSSPVASPLPAYWIGSPSAATVSIADNDQPVQTNRPPTVLIVQPGMGMTFPAGANIALLADARDTGGSVASVEFFANNHSLGHGVRAGTSAGTLSSNLWSLIWSNAPAGEATLSAKATDNQGAMALSPGVRILVGSNTPPSPTNNQPILVSITATDPHASEGLAMWCSNTVVGVNHEPVRTNLPCVLGTNTATFTVRRTGSTSNSLRVYYAIGGTASNGVDYAPLSGVVTIPAGMHSAQIRVLPIDDLLPEGLETVALRLRLPPLPLDPADSPYSLGRPADAAAFIMDNDKAPPPPCRLPDGMFHHCEKITNGCFRVEVTTNLVHWDIVCTNAVADGMARHIDCEGTNHLHRFYRIVPVPCPPAQP